MMPRSTALFALLLCAAIAPLRAQPVSFDQYLCRVAAPAGWQRADVGSPPAGASLLALQSPSGKSRLALVVIEVQRTLTLDDPAFVDGLRESIMGKLRGVSCTFGTLAGVKSLQCSGASPEDQSVSMRMTAVVANGHGYVLTAVGPASEITGAEATEFFNSFSFIGPPAEHQSAGTDESGRPIASSQNDAPIGTIFLKYLLPLLLVVGLGYVISAISARNEKRRQQESGNHPS
jgi:hypothetical protein